jgi:hypothetical protein
MKRKETATRRSFLIIRPSFFKRPILHRATKKNGRGDKGSPAPRRPVSPMAKERHPESAAAEEMKPKAPAMYQLSEQPSSRVQEEEFAKQLRLARYLAAGGSPPSRPLESVRQARTPKQERAIPKAGAKTTGKKAREEELAKERRRAGQVARQRSLSSASHRGEKQRQSHDR